MEQKKRPNQNYALHEEWYQFVYWLLDKCDKMPKHIRFTVSGRIANLALEVQESLIRASYTAKTHQAVILKEINIQLEQLRLYMRLCKDRQYISISQYEFASKSINTSGRMCGGWLKSLQT
jgi:hypothetical protein